MTSRQTIRFRRSDRTAGRIIARREAQPDQNAEHGQFSHAFHQTLPGEADQTPSAEGQEQPQGEAPLNGAIQRILVGERRVQRQECPTSLGEKFDAITAEAARIRPGLPGTFAEYRRRIDQSATFLGVRISGGIDREMVAVLRRAEQELNFTPGSRDQHGVYQIGGMDASRVHGLHSWGLAIDVNTPTNPYVMHEAGEAQLDRQLAPVYERIAWFILGRSSVIPRQIQQSSGGSREPCTRRSGT